MLAYTSRRIVYVIPIVLSVALVCFLLVHITPGDPLVAVLPADASQELAAQLRSAYGFDRPLPVQFGLWLWRAIHGDLGNSIATGRPVLSEVMRAVGNTVMLAVAAAMIGFTLGLLFGLIAGYFRDTWVDKVATSIALWFGFAHLLEFLLYASLFGGVLTLALLQFRQWPLPYALCKQGWLLHLHHKETGIPYGIALAIGALMVYPETEWIKAVAFARFAVS